MPASDRSRRFPRTRAMLRVLAVYLLIGLAASVAVAWGLAITRIDGHTLPSYHTVELDGEEQHWLGITSKSWLGRTFVAYSIFDSYSDAGSIGSNYFLLMMRSSGAGSEWSSSVWSWDPAGPQGWGQRRLALNDGPESPWAMGYDHASGFPALALWNSWAEKATQSSYEPDFTQPHVGGIDLDRLLQGSGPPPQRPYGSIPKTLPYRPIWLGLAINTAFYALVLFAFVRLVKGARQLRRFRRGKCPRCGYDLLATFTGPCPECGRAACKLAPDAAAQP